MSTCSPVGSPCINICQMDEATGWCAGCLRSIDEIVAWGRLDDAAKRAVWAALPARRDAWAAAGRPEAIPRSLAERLQARQAPRG